jgi:hypothetical protein
MKQMKNYNSKLNKRASARLLKHFRLSTRFIACQSAMPQKKFSIFAGTGTCAIYIMHTQRKPRLP